MDALKKNSLLILIAVMFATRLVLVFWGPLYFDSEEHYRVIVADQIVKGLPFPLIDYQHLPYEGGSVAVALMAIPFMLLFGFSVSSLKAIAILVPILTLMVMFRFLNRYCGFTAAVAAAVLYVFPPLSYTQYCFFVKGNYTETVLAMFLLFAFFFRCVHNKDSSHLRYLLFGLLSGFSVFYSYYCVQYLVAVFLFWFLIDRTFFLNRRFFTYCCGCIIGFAPWLWFNITNNFSGLHMYSALPLDGSEGTTLDRFLYILLQGYRNVIQYRNLSILKGSWFGQYLYILFSVSAVWLLYKERGCAVRLVRSLFTRAGTKNAAALLSAPLFFLSTFFVFIAVFSFSPMTTRNQPAYYYTSFLIIYVIIAIGLNSLAASWAAGKKALVLTALLCPVVLASMWSHAATISRSGVPALLTEPYNFWSTEVFGIIIGRTYKNDLRTAIEIAEQVDMDKKFLRNLYSGLPVYITWDDCRPDLEQCREIIATASAAGHPFLYRFLARSLVRRSLNDLSTALETIGTFPRQFHLIALDGIGRGLRNWYMDVEIATILERVSQVDPRLRGYVLNGFGEKHTVLLRWPVDSCLRVLPLVPPEYKPHFIHGLGRNICWYFLRNIADVRKVLEQFEPQYQRHFIEGVGWKAYALLGPEAFANTTISRILTPTEKASFMNGARAFYAIDQEVSALLEQQAER